MADPGYDFFATGRVAGASPPALPDQGGRPAPSAAHDRFGGPAAPTTTQFGTPAAPTTHQFGTPAAPTTNQFGTPAAPTTHQFGTSVAPTTNQFGASVAPVLGPLGPQAAAGATNPVDHAVGRRGHAGPASAWDGPAPVGRSAHGAHAARTGRRPDSVFTAAVVGLVISGLVLLMAAVVLFLYLAVKGELDAAGVGPAAAGLDELMSAVTTALLQLVGICVAFGLLYAVAGVAVLKGRPWGAWTLLVLGSLTVLRATYDLVTSGLPSVSTGYLAGWIISTGLAAVLVGMLLQPAALRWMRGD